MTRVTLTVEQLWQAVPGGSGSYVTELVAELARRGDVTVTGLAAWHPRGERDGRVGPAPVRYLGLPRQVLYRTWNHVRRPVVGRADVVHATTWALPGSRVPLVVTVHDLAFRRDPEHFTPHGVRFFTRALQAVADEAAAIVVPSRHTADDLADWGLDDDRVAVIPHGVRAATVAADDIARWCRQAGVTRPYVLWCGTVEPRKNVPRLVAAFARARSSGLDAQLVLAGPDGWGGEASRVAEEVARLGPAVVRRVGRLSAADLQVAYAGATCFAFPSLWEGFGMPVLEAMAHGVPVVTSAGTAPAEIAGDAGVSVDPRSVDEIAAGLLAVREVTDRGVVRRRASGYSWAASAQAHAEVYVRVAR